MVHAVRFTWKFGFGYVNERNAARLGAAVEFGYFLGSVLFLLGTVFFFPVEWLENFTTGCRFYEVGSVVFGLLTLYTELDRYQARKRVDALREVTKRELLEELMYCVGSFVFLVGTFLFDPPLVEAMSDAFGVDGAEIENTAAILFMLGSFMFSLGSYVNALSIFEAPKIVRNVLISVTTCYQFGALFFVAGTMGYVEAFKPNLLMKWVATWFYMVGCVFYVVGSILSFISTVASQQVRYEQAQKREKRKQKSMAQKIGRAGTAIPRALKAAARKRRHQRSKGGAPACADDGEISVAETTGSAGSDPAASPDVTDVEGLDLEMAEDELTDKFAEEHLADKLSVVLGPETGRELAAVLVDEEEEDDVFGAFWRSVKSTPFALPLAVTAGTEHTPYDDGDATTGPTVRANADGQMSPSRQSRVSGAFQSAFASPQQPVTAVFKDNISLVDHRAS